MERENGSMSFWRATKQCPSSSESIRQGARNAKMRVVQCPSGSALKQCHGTIGCKDSPDWGERSKDRKTIRVNLRVAVAAAAVVSLLDILP
eukprot:scaffold1352_cov180-Amphora_coffeaeformis.AAC.3